MAEFSAKAVLFGRQSDLGPVALEKSLYVSFEFFALGKKRFEIAMNDLNVCELLTNTSAKRNTLSYVNAIAVM